MRGRGPRSFATGAYSLRARLPSCGQTEYQDVQSDSHVTLCGYVDTVADKRTLQPGPWNFEEISQEENRDPRAWVSRSATDAASVDLLKAKAIWGRVQEVFVFLFSDGETTMDAGIYSLRTSNPEQVPKETVVAFQCLSDAERFADDLASTMHQQPCVHGIAPEQLVEFCVDAGYDCQLESIGSQLSPPACNVSVTDWERARRLRSGIYCIAETSLDAADQDLASALATDPFVCCDAGSDGLTPFLEDLVWQCYNAAPTKMDSLCPSVFDNESNAALALTANQIERARLELESVFRS